MEINLVVRKTLSGRGMPLLIIMTKTSRKLSSEILPSCEPEVGCRNDIFAQNSNCCGGHHCRPLE